MTLSRPSRRHLVAAVVALLGAAAATVALLALTAGTSRAESNPNSYDCQGHLEAGKPLPGDDDTSVAYFFACNGPVLGYQIQPQLADTNFDTAPIVIDKAGNPVTTDSFSCAGDFPGYGVNCTGSYSGDYNVVKGSFSIAEKLCDEPRVDALLTVVYATADAKGKVTQYMSGPYDLGRPRGCKPSKFSGKTRIPQG